MSHTLHTRSTADNACADARTAPVDPLRVDGAHVLGDAPPPALEPAAETIAPLSHSQTDESSASWLGDFVTRVRTQGRQLANLLRSRQRDLDRREAQLQSQSAALDNDQRSARLWFVEQHRDLELRRTALDQRAVDLEHRESRLQAAELAQEASRQEAMLEVERREAVLARRQSELEATAERLAHQKEIARELEIIAQQVERRAANVLEAERLQARADAELNQLRRDIADQRQQLAEQARAERRQMAEQRRISLAENARQLELVRQRHQQLEVERRELEQSRDRGEWLHREALESRLVAEETLARARDAYDADALAAALAESRRLLADHWRGVAARVLDEQTAMVRLREELSQRMQAMRNQQSAWEQSIEKRHFDFQRRDEAVTSREQSVNEAEQQLRHQRDRWNEDRVALVRQLRAETARNCEIDEAAK